MKKIFAISIMALAMCSCATYTITGNVTLLSDNGDEIEKWDNATIHNNAKSNIYGYKNNIINVTVDNGVDFTTEQGERMYVNGGIIIVRDLKRNVHIATEQADSTDYSFDDPNYYGG